MSNGLSIIATLLFALVAIGALVAVPALALVSGIARMRRKQGGMIRLLFGMAMLLFTVFVFDSFFGPWHKRILDQGMTPDGRKFALLQVGGGEPFEIRLYVRSEEAGWGFHYVDHEVFPWRSGGHVEFSPDTSTAQVFHGSKVFKTVDILPPERIREEGTHFPPSDTPEDILRRLTSL